MVRKMIKFTIESIKGYAMPLPEEEFHLETSSDDDSDNESSQGYFSVVSDNGVNE